VSIARAPLLLADVGGTNVRVAPAGGETILRLRTSDFGGLIEAVEEALSHFHLRAEDLAGIAVCAAGPLELDAQGHGRIRMTNCPWEVSAAALAAFLGRREIVLVNDFVAAACGVEALDSVHCERIASAVSREPDPARTIAVLGPGTGLGLSGLVREPATGREAAIAGEGGHRLLPPVGADDLDLLRTLSIQSAPDPVSLEYVLCGRGLSRLYAALSGRPADEAPAPEAMAAAAGTDPIAAEAIRRFTRFLGAAAGDTALTLGAEGGVYLTGGVVPHLGPRFDRNVFREAFDAKGPFTEYVRRIPVCLIRSGEPALLGLERLWRRQYAGAAGAAR